MIPFLKMHGCGNDFIVFDDAEDRFGWHDLSAMAREFCRRRFSIGADGLIAIGRPADRRVHYEMRYLNADGSRAEMCGNGIRCVGKFAADILGETREEVSVLTGAGVRLLKLHHGEHGVESVTVSMGIPSLEAGEVPTTLANSEGQVIGCAVEVDGEQLNLTAVNVGNPHAVCIVGHITDHHVHTLGPKLEKHPTFPEGTNAEFIKVLGPGKIRMRVWERGVGETWACGTGACASVVAAVLNEHAMYGDEVKVILNGGELKITWPAPNAEVEMTGPAVTAYRGELPV